MTPQETLAARETVIPNLREYYEQMNMEQLRARDATIERLRSDVKRLREAIEGGLNIECRRQHFGEDHHVLLIEKYRAALSATQERPQP